MSASSTGHVKPGAVPRKRTFAQVLLDKNSWWAHFAIVSVISIVGLIALGVWTYQGAPPYVPFVSSSTGQTVIPFEQIARGKEVWHLRGLMDWGSFWGDGADRGPDFTADALHRTVVSMKTYYENEAKRDRALTQNDQDAFVVRVQREIHANGYDEQAGVIRINDAQIFAFNELVTHYTRMFTDPTYSEKFRIDGYITDREDLKALASYFFWGGWVSGADRPGEVYSYTHNWPYDPDAANIPTSATLLWSFLSILGLFIGIMLVLYVYGQMRSLPGDPFNGSQGGTLTTTELEKGYDYVRPTQRATYKFFAFAMILFLLQVLVGILSAEDFVVADGSTAPGHAITTFLGLTVPFTVVKSLHAIVQIYWFFMCWVGYTIFFLPKLSRVPNGQRFLINLLFGLALLVGAGAAFGIPAGQMGYLSDDVSYWFGSQGWEFMELGRFWQILMLGAFVLWIAIIFRGVRPWITKANLWSVPAWLFYGSGIMVLFLFFGMMVTPRANFAISDYWRWMVVHMWVEVTFEVFTTCIVGYMLVQMGLLTRPMAERVIFLAVMMFLVTATVGISHNFYWIAKPTGIIALGSIFSTLQVVPLVLITLDAWRMRREKILAKEHVRDGKQAFVMDGVWMFILAINFWNIIGAGILGSLINLPIVNYFEHSTYLTGNHAHAAMFGVKGNVAIGGMLFCCQHLFARSAWNEKLVQRVFWALQIGLVLMMTLDLFPVGLYQLWNVVQHGYWYVRTESFVTGGVFTTLTWFRTIGGVVFLFGGVLPLVWFVLSRGRSLVREVEIEEGEWSVYDKDWAAHEPEIVRISQES
ncbi:MAG: nitric-oxide reductase [Acidobacteria bacterium RIFCSPLOWO2_12_FULL_65_11]|nr:MAG: nitric-oxide reductase [Acidobacteria bacterium RIFCSPLOWO2_02_FULL_64_15]OFW30460.1 MAG: nitric-oxide reductase [Acidobacteria bacterium RIFCSPLOWO2_12_FULL_65_11]